MTPLRLGKQAPRQDERDLRLARYTAKLLRPPTRTKFSTVVSSWPMYRNDQLGDCAIADPAHAIQLVTALGVLRESRVTDSDVLKGYEAVGHYKPSDPSTDRGCVMGDVMDYMRKTGLGGHRIDGYASVNPHNIVEVKQAITFFGGAHLGLALPLSAQSQVGKTWAASTSKTKGAAGSWGGHAVLLTDYDSSGLACITWGGVQRMTWAFLAKYADEMFVSLSAEWITPATKKSPQGIGMDELRADLLQFS